MTAPSPSKATPDVVVDHPAWTGTGKEAAQAAPGGVWRLSGVDRLAALILLLAVLASGLAAFGLPSSPPQDGGPVLVAASPRPSASPGAFLRQPPFDALRRPIAGIDLLPALAASQPIPAVEQLSVAGVIAGTGDPRVLFLSGATWQGLGSDHLGWRVEAIGPDAVTLARGGVSRVLRTRDALRP